MEDGDEVPIDISTEDAATYPREVLRYRSILEHRPLHVRRRLDLLASPRGPPSPAERPAIVARCNLVRSCRVPVASRASFLSQSSPLLFPPLFFFVCYFFRPAARCTTQLFLKPSVPVLRSGRGTSRGWRRVVATLPLPFADPRSPHSHRPCCLDSEPRSKWANVRCHIPRADNSRCSDG